MRARQGPRARRPNVESRLIRVKPTPGTERDGLFKVEFAYDYLGRRIEKKVWRYGEARWGTPTVRRFVYHGWRMLLEMDGGLGVPPVNFVVRKYTWGLDLAGLNGAINSVGGAGGIGGLLAMQDPNDPNDPNDPFGDFVYLYDGNGNVGQLVDWSHDPNDPNGAIVATYQYDPYGNIIAQSGSYADENPFQYSTKHYDAESGLSDFGHRYYHAGLGRWLSRDPIGELGGPNLYGFVGNSPVNYVDYLGYMWVDCPYGICRGNQGDCPGRPGGSTPRYPDRDGHAGGGGHRNRADIVDPWGAFGTYSDLPPAVRQYVHQLEQLRPVMPPWWQAWLDWLFKSLRNGQKPPIRLFWSEIPPKYQTSSAATPPSHTDWPYWALVNSVGNALYIWGHGVAGGTHLYGGESWETLLEPKVIQKLATVLRPDGVLYLYACHSGEDPFTIQQLGDASPNIDTVVGVRGELDELPFGRFLSPYWPGYWWEPEDGLVFYIVRRSR